ncbi:MAG TPA: hypothetical protein VKG02_15330, partial [Blastocatellia bacterium]|nr:hypothetical protein [Blastocatellia bacterium]
YTLLLDQINWDIVCDVNGNIAVASNPYALAQDAASAIKTFEGEVYFDTTYGLPYWTQVLGHAPPLPLVKQYFNAQALTVPEVATAVSFITGVVERDLTGQVQITSDDGQLSASGI